jgi:hypothetical protein
MKTYILDDAEFATCHELCRRIMSENDCTLNGDVRVQIPQGLNILTLWFHSIERANKDGIVELVEGIQSMSSMVLINTVDEMAEELHKRIQQHIEDPTLLNLFLGLPTPLEDIYEIVRDESKQARLVYKRLPDDESEITVRDWISRNAVRKQMGLEPEPPPKGLKAIQALDFKSTSATHPFLKNRLEN